MRELEQHVGAGLHGLAEPMVEPRAKDLNDRILGHPRHLPTAAEVLLHLPGDKRPSGARAGRVPKAGISAAGEGW